MEISNNKYKAKQISFSGLKTQTDNYGFKECKFFYLYDDTKYDAKVALYDVEQDSDGEFRILNPENPKAEYSLKKDGNSDGICLDDHFAPKQNFAYRFILTPKDGSAPIYAFDPGVVTGGNMVTNESYRMPASSINRTDDKFNVVFRNGASINKTGPMQLIMPDEFYPGVVMNEDGKTSVNDAMRAKALATTRTHINKLGGGFAGIIHKLDDLEKEGYSRIVGMPLTKDTVSSHLYWTQNAYQIAPQLGDMKEYRTFQQELFKHGINWTADAALVNEGLEGIHFSNLLRYGEQSPYKYWFKSDDYLQLGVIPNDTKNTRLKLINSPVSVVEKDGTSEVVENKDYDSSKPTMVQLYDQRLVDEKQKNDNTKRIVTYAKNNPDNPYEMVKHDDMVYPYAFQVNPQVLVKNINNAKKGSNFDITNIDTIKQILHFENFAITPKSETSGFELWDGNVDIAKLNFYLGNQDQERVNALPPEDRKEAMAEMNRAIYNVQDYALTSGQYWTQLTQDMQIEYVAKLLRGLDDYETIDEKINALVDKGQLPQSARVKSHLDKDVARTSKSAIDLAMIQNIYNGEYNFQKLNSVAMRDKCNPEGQNNNYTVQDFILRNAMDLPLETLPCANDLLGVLGSPYISKKASTKDELGVSRYDLYKAGDKNLSNEYKNTYDEMTKFYTKSLAPRIMEIITKSGLQLEDSHKVNDLGKYILSEITPELTQYLLVKALNPSAEITITPDYHFDFSKVKPEDMNLRTLGMSATEVSSPEAEAMSVVKALEKGMNLLDIDDIQKLSDVIKNRYKDADLLSYRLADVIVDRTESGMGWRIDAAKDIASMDAVRQGYDTIDKAWDSVIDFWKAFNQSVLAINPHAYTAAEITDMATFFKNGPVGKYKDDNDCERRFLEETGITTIANYSYLYSIMPEIFTQTNVETGAANQKCLSEENKELREKFDKAWQNNPGFMFQGPIDSVISSYTFLGNHDKPRILHFCALDMGMFYANLNDSNDQHHRNITKEVLQKDDGIDWSTVKAPAIAMGKRIRQSLDKVSVDEQTKNALQNAIATLASGNFKGQSFNAEFFGARSFDIAIDNIIEQAKYDGSFSLSKEKEEMLKAELLKNILEPAFDRYYSMYKTMVTLPGAVTDFAGDKVGASGFETKSKNVFQQNRNVIRWEWLDNPNYAFIKNFYDNTNEILALRNRPELSALNDGVPVTLPQYATFDESKKAEDPKQHNKKFQAILRYNDKGSVVVTLYNAAGANANNHEMLNRSKEGASELKWNGYGEHSYIALTNNNADCKQSLKAGIKPGTIFKNARESDNSTYIVTVGPSGDYKLERRNEKGQPMNITVMPEDYNALVLYKVQD